MSDKAYKFSTRDDTTFRIGGGGVTPLILKRNSDSINYDHTFQEVYDALDAGVPVYIKNELDLPTGAHSRMLYPLVSADMEMESYTVYYFDYEINTHTAKLRSLVADSADSYLMELT